MGNSQVVRLAVAPGGPPVDVSARCSARCAPPASPSTRAGALDGHGWRTFASAPRRAGLLRAARAAWAFTSRGHSVPIKDTATTGPCPPGHSVSTSYARRTSCCRGARGTGRARTPRLGDDGGGSFVGAGPVVPTRLAGLGAAAGTAGARLVWLGDDLEGSTRAAARTTGPWRRIVALEPQHIEWCHDPRTALLERLASSGYWRRRPGGYSCWPTGRWRSCWARTPSSSISSRRRKWSPSHSRLASGPVCLGWPSATAAPSARSSSSDGHADHQHQGPGRQTPIRRSWRGCACWITSGYRARTSWGIVQSQLLGSLRLITKSNMVGRLHRQSAGLGAF